MNKTKKQRVTAFIDSQNLNISIQRLGWKVNWKKFREFLRDKYGVDRAYMFIGYMPEYEDLYEQMHDAGYLVVLKPTLDLTRPQPEMLNEKQIKRLELEKVAEEERHVKGNVDADLVLWAMKELSNYDKAVIVSGDGDFYSLVEYLESKGRLLKILTPSDHYSSLYNKFEDYLEQVNSYRKQLAYKDRGRKRTKTKK